ncbi:hypothetical protein [Helicobacter vulpis]|uniref:hypothetical protein n=1 Tax=Helicobacter vulpis TaxID=2316076 RepID=UPI0013CE3955|nr:hypothetical protein [Helicobacter vulpis]
MPIMHNGKSDCLTPKDLPIGTPSTGSIIGTALLGAAAAAYGIYKACSNDDKKEESK